MADRSLVVVVLMCATAIGDAAPAADRRDIGGLSFALPAKWKFDLPAGQDHAALTYADTTRYCIISLYQPIASDNLEVDFLREWRAVAGSIKDTQPRTSRRKVAGRDVIEASGTITANEGSVVFERVGVIGGNDHLTTMVVLTADEATHRACQPDADAIYASIKFASAAAAASGPAPAPGKPPLPANGLAGTMRTTITLADLAGTWTSGASVLSYYATASGDYAGSTASFAGMTYTFRANGTYEYSESGMSNGSRFRNTDAGTVALTGGNIVLTSKDGRVNTRQLIAFMDLPDAAAVLTLFAGYAKGPLDAAGIAAQCYAKDGIYQCRYGELWSRAAPGAKGKTK